MTEHEITVLFRRARLLLVPVGCTWRPKSEVNQLRKRFNQSVKRAFKASANEAYRRYPVHHIIPLKLGGDNDHFNLALTQPNLHDAIHAYMDAQILALNPRVGSRFNLVIPMKLGGLWM